MSIFDMYGYSIQLEYEQVSSTSVYGDILNAIIEPPAPSTGFRPIIMFF